MRRYLLSLGLAILISIAAVQAAGGDAEWPGWRGPHRDGRSPDKGLLREWPAEGPKLVWKVDTLGIGFSSVAVSRGTIYTAGDSDGKELVLALDASDGKVKWRAEVGPACTAGGHNGSRATPTVDGDYVYFLSGDGVISCLAAKNGEKKWSHRLAEFGGKTPSWGYAESVLIASDKAIVTPGGANCIVAFDKKTGKEAWRSTGFHAPAHYSSCISITLDKKEMIVNGTGGGILAVSALTGQTLWSSDFCKSNTANCPTPVFADGRVFWANGYGKGGICLTLASKGKDVTATQAWTTSDMVCHHGGFIVDNGFIYGNHNKGWACLELATGQKKWFAPGVGKGSLCWADGMLYLFSENRGQAALAVCSPDGLKITGSVRVDGEGPSWAHPVVIGGRLYLRYGKNLYCFDVRGSESK